MQGYAIAPVLTLLGQQRSLSIPIATALPPSPLIVQLSISNFQLSNAIHSFIYCKEDVPSAGTVLHQVLDAVGLGACHQRRGAAAVQLL